MPRRKRKQKTVKVPQPIPTSGVWIKATMDENGGVTWTSNHKNAQRSSNMYGAVKDWFRAFNMETTKPSSPSMATHRTREFKGAMAAAFKAFNSRSHKRRFGVWFEIHTAPVDRAYVTWKLTQGSGVLEFVASQTDPNKQYMISGEDSNLTCTCPAFKFCKTSPKICKHIRQHLAAGAL